LPVALYVLVERHELSRDGEEPDSESVSWKTLRGMHRLDWIEREDSINAISGHGFAVERRPA